MVLKKKNDRLYRSNIIVFVVMIRAFAFTSITAGQNTYIIYYIIVWLTSVRTVRAFKSFSIIILYYYNRMLHEYGVYYIIPL